MAVLDQRRHRRLHRVRRRRPAAAGLPRRAPGAARSAPRSRRSTRTASRSIDEVGELVITEPMPSMPVFFWGDDDGSRYRASYFEHLPRRLAPRRLDRDHLARHGGDLRPLGLDDQPPGRPHGDERDLPRGRRTSPRSSTRSSSTCRGPGTEGWMPLFVVLREGAELDDDLSAEIKRRIREQCSPAPRPERGLPDRRGPADAERQGPGGPGQEDPHRDPAGARPRAATRSPTPRRSTTSSSWRGAPERGGAGLAWARPEPPRLSPRR